MIFDETRVLIRTEQLCKSYRFGNEMEEAVSGVDIRIMQGEFIVVEGFFGKRKNAFFNLMGCLERPDAGKYFFDYEDIALAKGDMLDNIRKNKIGYLFRNFNLITRLSAAENIEVPMSGLNMSREEKEKRLAKAQKSLDIEAIAEEKVSALSDTNRQLVSLARAVVNNPLMIIADEPAANLDNMGGQKLMEHLQSLNNGGMTILLFAEKPDIKLFSNYRLILFEDGRILEDKQEYTLSQSREGVLK